MNTKLSILNKLNVEINELNIIVLGTIKILIRLD